MVDLESAADSFGSMAEYDTVRDLLYIRLRSADDKAARTITIAPGVFADLDREGKLIGIEILDAAELLEERVQFEVSLPAASERLAA